jgi:hypothetical protein
MQGDVDLLRSLHRTGARGRIFARLIEDIWNVLEVSYRREPLFDHRAPDPWYVEFAERHEIKLRTHSFYNPDFVIDDGAWVETTLSENTAYAKFFRYGHQAPRLQVIWLDEDSGYHKSVCAAVAFPNARAVNVASLFPRIRECDAGGALIQKVILLKSLKGVVL